MERPIHVVIAPDSFKGCLSAVEAAAAIARGVRRAAPAAELRQLPMADGGEGTVEALVAAAGGAVVQVEVTGPLGEPVSAFYGRLDDGRTAVIEMAAASGLPLVPAERRNPLAATSFGTGELMRRAVDDGCTRLILGLGGSATNDGGMGVAQALGVRFRDEAGVELGMGAEMLERIVEIDPSGLDPRFREVEIVVSCDVSNPLCGPEGASAIYGPQKGATPEMVQRLDKGLAHYAERLRELTGRDVAQIPGSGAAGGLAVPLLAFMKAEMRRGIDIVTESAGLEEAVRGSDLVFTGEGRTDEQTAYGKVPSGVSRIAQRHGVPVVCLSGGLGRGIDALYPVGVTALFSIVNSPMTLEEAMDQAAPLLEQAAENAVRLFLGAGRR